MAFAHTIRILPPHDAMRASEDGKQDHQCARHHPRTAGAGKGAAPIFILGGHLVDPLHLLGPPLFLLGFVVLLGLVLLLGLLVILGLTLLLGLLVLLVQHCLIDASSSWCSVNGGHVLVLDHSGRRPQGWTHDPPPRPPIRPHDVEQGLDVLLHRPHIHAQMLVVGSQRLDLVVEGGVRNLRGVGGNSGGARLQGHLRNCYYHYSLSLDPAILSILPHKILEERSLRICRLDLLFLGCDFFRLGLCSVNR